MITEKKKNHLPLAFHNSWGGFCVELAIVSFTRHESTRSMRGVGAWILLCNIFFETHG